MPDLIHNWETYLGERTLEEHAEGNPNGMLNRSIPHGLKVNPRAVARVSGSCWIADCPSGDGGAEFVNFTDLRFFCCTCRNAAWGGKALEVLPPDPAFRLQVEKVLLNRPDPDTRNWSPEESLADLKAENLTHGVNP